MQMTLAAIQFHPTTGDRTKNLQHIEHLIAQAVEKGAQLILLPETCDLGYDLATIQRLAEPFPNPSTETFAGVAKRHGVTIVAGLAERRGKNIFNTAVIFDPHGEMVAQYDKTHLCPIPPADEAACFQAGNKLVGVDVLGMKMGMTICYDIRFPEIYRKLTLNGAQLIVHPTAFPRVRIEQLEVCLRARAIENQVFMISANQCGKGSALEFGGRSMIVGPSGEILAKANDTDETVIVATVDLDEVDRIRREKPVLTHRRPELYCR